MTGTPDTNPGGEVEVEQAAFRPGTPVKIDYFDVDNGCDVYDLGVVMKAPDVDGNVRVKFFGGCSIQPLSQDKITPLGVDPEAEVGDYACFKTRRARSILSAVVWGRIMDQKGDTFYVEPTEDYGPGFTRQVRVPRRKLRAAVKTRF